MSPTCPCASAWPTGSPCPPSRRGACRAPAGSGNRAGGLRGRCRRTSCTTSWGCQRATVPSPPVGWSLAAAAEGGNRRGWFAPAGARWARTWCLCSGWCWWRGWSPEVGGFHHYGGDMEDIWYQVKNKINAEKYGWLRVKSQASWALLLC